MTVVIDVGCARYGGDYSLEKLLEQYKPSRIYGFDPNSDEGYGTALAALTGVPVVVQRAVAFTYDGTVGFVTAGLGSHVDSHGPDVTCVDLARFILDLQTDEGVAVKIDAEGSEYALLEHLIARGADRRIAKLMVEWHCSNCRNGTWSHADGCGPDFDSNLPRRTALEAALSCPVEEWCG